MCPLLALLLTLSNLSTSGRSPLSRLFQVIAKALWSALGCFI